MRQLEVHTWFERDRAHVELRDSETDETIVEAWDEDLRDLVDLGILNPKDWKGSLIEYARAHGLLNEGVSK